MIRPFSLSDISSVVEIWNSACGANLAISTRFVQYNTQLATGAVQQGRIAIENNVPIGFVLASALPNDPKTSASHVGWVDAIAVRSEFQHRGVANELLTWAEDFLRAQQCTIARLGGSLHPFVAGLPDELNNLGWFNKRGYLPRPNAETDWDVARDLIDYKARADYASFDATVRPACADDNDAIMEFFMRDFPGRWRYEYEQALRDGGRDSDFMILVTDEGVDGVARLTYEDSERPVERFYMHALPHPWGQLGSIGVSKRVRGQGLGGMLLDLSLCHMRNLGIRGCVIDWTSLVDFYDKYGFKPYRKYHMLVKNLG
jgi:GNAT superfamily N-acetyltransferase